MNVRREWGYQNETSENKAEGLNFRHLAINNVIIKCPHGRSSHSTSTSTDILSNIKYMYDLTVWRLKLNADWWKQHIVLP